MRTSGRKQSTKSAKFLKNHSKRTIEQNWSISMKHLASIASKPQLVAIILDDEATIQEFGEPIEFHTWDRQPLDIFLKLANREQTDASSMLDIVRTLILDDKGNQLIKDDNTLPTTLLMRVITKVVDMLGK
jgi:hypothetical protein